MPGAGWSVTGTDSEAPTIGRVRGPVESRIRAGVAFRPSAWSLDSVLLGDVHVGAASAVGTAHLANGTPRQDAYDFVLTLDGRLVVAVADGLGSREHSQVGARLFCEAVVRMAAGSMPALAPEKYLLEAADVAARIARDAYGLPPEAIGFVAEVAVLNADAGRLARIGDVTAFALDPDGSFPELFGHDDGFLNVVQQRLPSAAALQPELAGCDRNRPLVLSTDGLATDLRNSGQTREWLASRWRTPTDVFGLADALRYRRQGSHDDRTAVVLTFRPPDLEPVDLEPVGLEPVAVDLEPVAVAVEQGDDAGAQVDDAVEQDGGKTDAQPGETEPQTSEQTGETPVEEEWWP